MPHDNTTLAYNLADVNGTLHDVVERSVVESAGFFTRGTWLDKHFHATETFGTAQTPFFVQSDVKGPLLSVGKLTQSGAEVKFGDKNSWIDLQTDAGVHRVLVRVKGKT